MICDNANIDGSFNGFADVRNILCKVNGCSSVLETNSNGLDGACSSSSLKANKERVCGCGKQDKIYNCYSTGRYFKANDARDGLEDLSSSCSRINIRTSLADTAGVQSRPSQLGSSSHIHQPSTPEERAKTTRRYLASATTISYTMFVIIFGFVSFAGSALTNRSFFAELYMIFLMVIGGGYMIYLVVDIRRHIKAIKKVTKTYEVYNNAQLDNTETLEVGVDGPMELNLSNERSKSVDLGNTNIRHKYCFVRGRHGEFLYLKSGAAWFCFGLLIHSCLVLMYEIYYATSSDETIRQCGSLLSISFEIIFPIYSVFSLLFIYKYINLVINLNRKLARFMLMHMIATSVSFWIYQIVCETKEAVILSDASKRGLQGIATSRLLFLSPECAGPDSLSNFYKTFSPYLYPFIIEFFILSAGVWTMMLLNINKCPKKDISEGETSQLTRSNQSIVESEYDNLSSYATDHETHVRTNIEVHIDCHGSNRGLFLGLVLMVLTICFIILFFVTTSEKSHLVLGLMLDRTFELAVLVVMIFAVVGAYIKTSKLDINTHSISRLDDILLFITLPAFFTYAALSILPAIHYRLPINACNIIAQVVQVFIQTPFIMDGLRRCSNSSTFRKKKPGREFVTFLTIANISLWIYYTFSVKIDETGDERYEYYGYTLWSILYHLCLPLIMFYRFHSSVCLVDIWKHAYEPAAQ